MSSEVRLSIVVATCCMSNEVRLSIVVATYCMSIEARQSTATAIAPLTLGLKTPAIRTIISQMQDAGGWAVRVVAAWWMHGPRGKNPHGQ